MQLDLARGEFRAQKSKWSEKQADLEKQRAQLQGKDTGYAAQLRKREKETKKVQDQLQKMVSKKGARKPGVALTSAIKSACGPTNEAEAFLARVGGAYAEQLGELKAENDSLRELLSSLVTDLSHVCDEAAGEDATSAVAEAQQQMHLPAEWVASEMQAVIQGRLEQVRDMLEEAAAARSAAEAAQATPAASPGLLQRRTSELQRLKERTQELETQLAEMTVDLAKKNGHLDDAQTMIELLRNQAHKQLGESEAAAAIAVREKACEARAQALEREAERLEVLGATQRAAAASIEARHVQLEAAQQQQQEQQGGASAAALPGGGGSGGLGSPGLSGLFGSLGLFGTPTSTTTAAETNKENLVSAAPAMSPAGSATRKKNFGKISVTPSKTSLTNIAAGGFACTAASSTATAATAAASIGALFGVAVPNVATPESTATSVEE